MKSFKETYKFLRVYNLSKNKLTLRDREEIEDILKTIDDELEKLSFPAFINKVEELLEQNLPFRDEIVSINQVRNCLVHRDGVVGERDVSRSVTNELCLKWKSPKFWAQVNGEIQEVTYDSRKEGMIADSLSMEVVAQEKRFSVGERVTIDINDFNGIAYTCATFVKELYEVLPKR